MFSRRVPQDLKPSAWARARAARGALPYDLTVSNPTLCGFDYPHGLLDPLRDPAALRKFMQGSGDLFLRFESAFSLKSLDYNLASRYLTRLGFKDSMLSQLEGLDLIGEIGILCDLPRTATIKAVSRVTTLKIAKDLFFQMVIDFPSMGVEVMRELAHRLEKTTADLREARSRIAQ